MKKKKRQKTDWQLPKVRGGGRGNSIKIKNEGIPFW